MENLDEIKARLDVLYQEYKKNKSHLSPNKMQNVVKLLNVMTFAKDAEDGEGAECKSAPFKTKSI